MNTKMLIAAMTIAMGTAGFAPSIVEAGPYKHLKKAKKQERKFHKKMAKQHFKSYHKPYRYKTPKVERESFGIYTTPTGGLGLHYSEHKSKYRAPYSPYGAFPHPGYHQVGGHGINIRF